MSGFIGILNLDGAPVDRDLMQRLTQLLTFRGPDAQRLLQQSETVGDDLAWPDHR